MRLQKQRQAEKRLGRYKGLLDDNQHTEAIWVSSYIYLRTSEPATKISLRLHPSTSAPTTHTDNDRTSPAFPVFYNDISILPRLQSRNRIRNTISVNLLQSQTCLATRKRFPSRLAEVKYQSLDS